MPADTTWEQREHDLTVHVFSISAAMIGVCLTAIGILRIVTVQTNVQTFGDELLAVDALLFVICCFLSFWSFKSRKPEYRRRLRIAVDVLFMLALVVMVAVCGMIAWWVL